MYVLVAVDVFVTEGALVVAGCTRDSVCSRSGACTRGGRCSRGDGELVAVDVAVVLEGEGYGLSSALGSESGLGLVQRFRGAIGISAGSGLGISDRLM